MMMARLRAHNDSVNEKNISIPAVLNKLSTMNLHTTIIYITLNSASTVVILVGVRVVVGAHGG